MFGLEWRWMVVNLDEAARLWFGRFVDLGRYGNARGDSLCNHDCEYDVA